MGLYQKTLHGAVFISLWLIDEYCAKGKRLYMYFVDLEKNLQSTSKQVINDLVKKGVLSEILLAD